MTVRGSLLTALLLWLFATPAGAANACRGACRAEAKQCTAAANAAFKAAKPQCLAIVDPAARRACRKQARAARSAAKAACRSTRKTCLGGCGKGGGTACGASSAGNWLATVNFHRDLAGLPGVTEMPAWSSGAAQHAEYCVREDYVGHDEDPASPYYSADGRAAGQNGNVAGHSAGDKDDGWAVDLWMTGPFHAVGVIDPILGQSGFGIAYDAGGSVRTAAVLDVLRGLDTSLLGGATLPVLYPGDGTTFPLDRYAGNEFPDPLTSCSGYAPPTGPPLMALVAPGFAGTPPVTAASVARDGTPVDVCVFDANTYANPDAGQQALARQVLNARGAVVLLPRAPLQRGSVYTVALTVAGQPVSWSFTHDCP